ncbi:MAG: lamin tail domain-containing protein [Humibacillus sp.]|nr:lamin tail domain-containing protein [Humibacillus sp.]MDN5779374.1 lamin tail domain-containing protein [Humibacillus sp.]
MPFAARLAAATLTVASLTALPLTFATSTAAAATPAVKISYVYFDSPGADKGGNTSLNAEYVRITNTTGTARSLKGWTLRDRSNHVYTFPAFTLKARATVIVHTGKGTATSAHRYYNKSWYVWNNTGDTAYLRDSRGKTMHTCAWTTSKTGTKSC